MTGKELADQLFEAFAQGTPGNDPGLADRMEVEIAKLNTDEMWRFVYVAGTRGANFGTARDASIPHDAKEVFAAFNVAIAQRNGYKAAIQAMHAAPKPAEWPPTIE